MTYLIQDIRDHLVGSTAIVNDVGSNIFADVIPQGTQYERAIVISEIAGDPEYYLGGEAGLHTSKIQIDYWTNGVGGPSEANTGRELIRNRLNGYRGTFGTGCYGTARMITDNSGFVAPIDGSDLNQRRVSMDFEIIHSADVPTFT